MIKSHVYLAKSILNRFSYEDKDGRKIIYYYNFDSKKIEKDTTASFNRIKGYYTDTNEDILKSLSEDKIGNIISFLEGKFKNNNYNFSLNNKMKRTIKRYVVYQLIRDDSMMQMVKDAMSNINYNAPYISEKERIRRKQIAYQYKIMDLQELKNEFINYEQILNMFFSVVNRLGIIIFFNTTKRNFVLTSSTSALNPYSQGYFMMNITLTPKICVTLCNKDKLRNGININDDIYISKLEDDEFVLKYNKKLYEVAKKNKPNILAGFKEDLEEIIQ